MKGPSEAFPQRRFKQLFTCGDMNLSSARLLLRNVRHFGRGDMQILHEYPQTLLTSGSFTGLKTAEAVGS